MENKDNVADQEEKDTVIKVDKYLAELSIIYAFHEYVQGHLLDEKLNERIRKERFDAAFEIINQFVTDEMVPGGPVARELMRMTETMVNNEISFGLDTLRRQIVVFCHSTLEKYLGHVVRAHLFPQIMKTTEKHVSYKEVVELKDGRAIFEHIVEREIFAFNMKSLAEKRRYLASRLKATRQEEAWTLDDKEWYLEIDNIRHSIIHEEEVPLVKEGFVKLTIFYVQRLIVSIAMNAYRDQGVMFRWPPLSDMVPHPMEPHLRKKS